MVVILISLLSADYSLKYFNFFYYVVLLEVKSFGNMVQFVSYSFDFESACNLEKKKKKKQLVCTQKSVLPVH